jgi:Na+-translocating ferredoxin:NAD+ oxidoreductase RnfC subunit
MVPADADFFISHHPLLPTYVGTAISKCNLRTMFKMLSWPGCEPGISCSLCLFYHHLSDTFKTIVIHHRQLAFLLFIIGYIKKKKKHT